jgi:SAM-dependent methyltransferase
MVRCGVAVAGAAGNLPQGPNVVAPKARLDICKLVRQRFYGRSNGVNTCGGGSMVLRTTGYCCICEAEATFEADGAWLRDCYVCLRCGTIPRVRALVHILNMVAPEWRNSKMHESSPGSHYFSERCKRYSYSFFYEDVPPGGSKFGNPCENLEALTFADQTFEIFVTQDVLEHVFHPDRALAEISRVLQAGGIHIFTAPKHKTLIESRRRASINAGGIAHHLPPEFHGNPISAEGSLVTWDYGADFDDRLREWSGYATSNYIIRDRALGIDGEFLDVFVTRKDERNRVRE